MRIHTTPEKKKENEAPMEFLIKCIHACFYKCEKIKREI